MSRGREVILERIRAAGGRGEGTMTPVGIAGESHPHSPVRREYDRRGSLSPQDRLFLLERRISDYQATVVRCGPLELSKIIHQRLARRGIHRLVVPQDLPQSWLEDGVGGFLELMRDRDPHPLTTLELDSAQGVLTGCALALAQTGTIVLDGGPSQGRRALSLLPDYHLCVVFGSQVVETVAEGVEGMMSSVKEAGSPITLVSGPSATSDIELERVEGVHGPRTLDVILVEGG